ncbi:unnamed protein product [Absidia cylindrospora]
MDVALENKAFIVAPHIPCDHCSCQGWRPSLPLSSQRNHQLGQNNDDMCECGNSALEHVDHWTNINCRLQLALRIKNILKENGKENDYSYTNSTIQTLQRQILENLSTEGFLSDTSPVSVPDEDDDQSPKRAQGSSISAGTETKRRKTDRHDHDEGKNPDQTNTHETSENDYNDENGDNRKNNHENNNVDGTNSTTKDTTASNQQQDASSRNIPATSTSLSPPSLDSNTNGDLLKKDTVNSNGVVHKNDDAVSTKLIQDHTVLERKEPLAIIEERKGEIVTKIVLNDGEPQNLIYLTGLKNIFQKQLPMMPQEYIARLVYDRNHRCLALIRPPLKVIGGICYRPFDEQDFAEIVFCAISSTEQVRGYGAHLMNHLKDYITTHTVMRHFLTYADNYATGYFKKQGFTTEITLDRRKWVGFIKDYEGGTIMQCTVVPEVNYLQSQNTMAVEQVNDVSTSRGVVSGLGIPMDEDGYNGIDPLSIPGVREPSRTSGMDSSSGTKHPPHYAQMRALVSELRNHASSWPFRKPVNADEVSDYYQMIRTPMDLATLEQNVEHFLYTAMDDFVADVQKIFDNCRTYNPEGTNYAKCATILEKYFYERLQVWSGSSG